MSDLVSDILINNLIVKKNYSFMFNLPDLNNNKSKGYCVTSAVKASIVYPVMKDVLEVISILSNC